MSNERFEIPNVDIFIVGEIIGALVGTITCGNVEGIIEGTIEGCVETLSGITVWGIEGLMV